MSVSESLVVLFLYCVVTAGQNLTPDIKDFHVFNRLPRVVHMNGGF